MLDLFFQIAVARGEDARVGADFAVGADALKPPVLRHAQQFRLQARRHFQNLIQKNRAAVRFFKPADAHCAGAGERTFFVAEQFAFQQRFGNRRAIHLDHRPVRPRAPRVEDIGDHFLARAAFAGDQHARLRRRDQRHFLKQRHRQRTLRDDLRRQFFFRAQIQRRQSARCPWPAGPWSAIHPDQSAWRDNSARRRASRPPRRGCRRRR